MRYKLVYTDKAQQDLLAYRRSGEQKLLLKIETLLNEVAGHPYSGTGKPEQLCGSLAGCWSRRINKQHRMVYRVEEERIIVIILKLRQHYSDK